MSGLSTPEQASTMAGGVRTLAEGCKPCAAMGSTQCIYAAMTLWAKAGFRRGTSPFVIIAYRLRHTLVLAPIAIVDNRYQMISEMSGRRGGAALLFLPRLGSPPSLAEGRGGQAGPYGPLTH